jgi:NSS family neurotransmitter:Na+ symporter
MYVAQAQGVTIFADDGSLVSGPGLVFTVLPSLFQSMGHVGLFVAFTFFVLMSVAALTSSISMLEGPVSYVVERHGLGRKKATTIIGIIIFMLSLAIISNIDVLLGAVATLATEYGQPIIAMLCCIFVVGFGNVVKC